MLLTTLLATAAAQSPWYATPVAVDLHPVGESLMGRWQRNVSDVMSGPGASPLFRSTAAAMDVHWRLSAYDTEPPWLMDDQRTRAMELSWVGTTMALQLTAQQILARNDTMSTIYRSLRTLTGPSLEVQRHGDSMRVRLNEGDKNPSVAIARLQESPPSLSPRLKVSSGLHLIESTELSDEGEEYVVIRPGLSIASSIDRAGPLSLRLRTSLMQTSDQGTTVDWLAMSQLNLTPSLSLLADAQGQLDTPRRLQAGVGWTHQSPDRTSVRLTGSQRLEDGEERVMVSITCPLRWYIPADIQRWPLGVVPGRPGPQPLLVRDRSPNTLQVLAEPPIPAGALVENTAASPWLQRPTVGEP